MNRLAAAVVLALVVAVVPAARSGHELPIYPSYYPHEIEITTVPPARAADLLLSGKLHAYIGRLAEPAGAPPGSIRAVESLGAFLIVRVNPESPLARESACAVAQAVIAHLDASGFLLHPYPVTPWHGDYLHHADLAEA